MQIGAKDQIELTGLRRAVVGVLEYYRQAGVGWIISGWFKPGISSAAELPKEPRLHITDIRPENVQEGAPKYKCRPRANIDEQEVHLAFPPLSEMVEDSSAGGRRRGVSGRGRGGMINVERPGGSAVASGLSHMTVGQSSGTELQEEPYGNREVQLHRAQGTTDKRVSGRRGRGRGQSTEVGSGTQKEVTGIGRGLKKTINTRSGLNTSIEAESGENVKDRSEVAGGNGKGQVTVKGTGKKSIEKGKKKSTGPVHAEVNKSIPASSVEDIVVSIFGQTSELGWGRHVSEVLRQDLGEGCKEAAAAIGTIEAGLQAGVEGTKEIDLRNKSNDRLRKEKEKQYKTIKMQSAKRRGISLQQANAAAGSMEQLISSNRGIEREEVGQSLSENVMVSVIDKDAIEMANTGAGKDQGGLTTNRGQLSIERFPAKSVGKTSEVKQVQVEERDNEGEAAEIMLGEEAAVESVGE